MADFVKQEKCVWIYRPGTYNSHFAMAKCDYSMKYLSKLNPCEPYVGVADFYNGIRCPSCGKAVQMDYSVIEWSEFA